MQTDHAKRWRRYLAAARAYVIYGVILVAVVGLVLINPTTHFSPVRQPLPASPATLVPIVSGANAVSTNASSGPEWAIALVSGLIGALVTAFLQVAWESWNRRRDLVAAIRVVRYELMTNGGALRASVLPHPTVDLAADLHDDAYRSVQLTLARQLKDSDLRQRLVLGYVHLTRAKEGRRKPLPVAQELGKLERDLAAVLESLGQDE